jgi:hypothetical protein
MTEIEEKDLALLKKAGLTPEPGIVYVAQAYRSKNFKKMLKREGGDDGYAPVFTQVESFQPEETTEYQNDIYCAVKNGARFIGAWTTGLTKEEIETLQAKFSLPLIQDNMTITLMHNQEFDMDVPAEKAIFRILKEGRLVGWNKDNIFALTGAQTRCFVLAESKNKKTNTSFSERKELFKKLDTLEKREEIVLGAFLCLMDESYSWEDMDYQSAKSLIQDLAEQDHKRLLALINDQDLAIKADILAFQRANVISKDSKGRYIHIGAASKRTEIGLNLTEAVAYFKKNPSFYNDCNLELKNELLAYSKGFFYLSTLEGKADTLPELIESVEFFDEATASQIKLYLKKNNLDVANNAKINLQTAKKFFTEQLV